jgi:hypothetical protein
MLFDLRGRGRRRVIKFVYVGLAFLMGGGLVLFGIGGEVSGGLVDAITERTGGGDDGAERLERREQQLVTRTNSNPQDAGAYAELARVRVQLSGQGENYDAGAQAYTESGVAELREATTAWERHLDLAADDPDDRVASLMVQAYSTLNELPDAVRAQEVVAEARNTPGPYSNLAALAYQAGQIRKGDLAADKALELTEPDLRETLRGQLEAAKAQATAGAAQDAASGDTGGG